MAAPAVMRDGGWQGFAQLKSQLWDVCFLPPFVLMVLKGSWDFPAPLITSTVLVAAGWQTAHPHGARQALFLGQSPWGVPGSLHKKTAFVLLVLICPLSRRGGTAWLGRYPWLAFSLLPFSLCPIVRAQLGRQHERVEDHGTWSQMAQLEP